MAGALGRHALIIEDEMLIALEVETLLEDLGFESFDIADTEDEALHCAERHRPDLITADIRIIGGSGIAAVRAITEALGAIPVVYVTGNPDLVGGQNSVAVVDKPIAPRALAAACARVCKAAA
ncbi:MAG TPA: response regulator [Caulobacteraceae bacterium]